MCSFNIQSFKTFTKKITFNGQWTMICKCVFISYCWTRDHQETKCQDVPGFLIPHWPHLSEMITPVVFCDSLFLSSSQACTIYHEEDWPQRGSSCQIKECPTSATREGSDCQTATTNKKSMYLNLSRSKIMSGVLFSLTVDNILCSTSSHLTFLLLAETVGASSASSQA